MAKDGPGGLEVHGEAVTRRGGCPVEDPDGLEHWCYEPQHDPSIALRFTSLANGKGPSRLGRA